MGYRDVAIMTTYYAVGKLWRQSIAFYRRSSVCLNQLQLTYKHICSCVAEPAGIYVTLASAPQLCPYARTQLTGW